MTVYDPLYGRFDIPSCVTRLAVTPEVRRLSQIRLLNTLTPSLATLGEIRRYSHTLGVLRLALNSSMEGFSPTERNAFYASILLHDIGTPPFAHLFEYHLRERSDGDWDHESVIRDILWGFHAPENRAHQLFGGSAIQVRRCLSQARIDAGLVEEIISGEHPLSELLFGTLDLDNLDNVARMGWALGLGRGPSIAMQLSSAISVDRSTKELICSEAMTSVVSEWAALRSDIYNILVFDGPTVAAQAVLSLAIKEMLDSGALTVDDWSMTDEQLLEFLSQNRSCKKRIASVYLGMLPSTVFCVRFTVDNVPREYRQHLSTAAQQAAEQALGTSQCIGYAFIDRGTFQKRLTFRTEEGKWWHSGNTSRSAIAYAFAPPGTKLSSERCSSACATFLREMKVSDDSLIRVVVPAKVSLDGQQSLTFPPFRD